MRAKFASRSHSGNPCEATSVPCAGFPIRAAKIRSVRDICRFVRANFPSVRAKSHPCGHFSICAKKKPICGAVAGRWMRIARSFNCGFDAVKIRKPRRGGRIFRNGFVCRPGGALFFGGVDPQLKLRAIFGCSFGAKKACQKLNGKIKL